jgi:hypothetical protein
MAPTILIPKAGFVGGIKMTDWNADFDALVRETMAFAKNNRIEPPTPRTIVEPPAPRTTVEPSRLPPASLPKSERDEIQQRVSNFRAHRNASRGNGRSLQRPF